MLIIFYKCLISILAQSVRKPQDVAHLTEATKFLKFLLELRDAAHNTFIVGGYEGRIKKINRLIHWMPYLPLNFYRYVEHVIAKEGAYHFPEYMQVLLEQKVDRMVRARNFLLTWEPNQLDELRDLLRYTELNKPTKKRRPRDKIKD